MLGELDIGFVGSPAFQPIDRTKRGPTRLFVDKIPEKGMRIALEAIYCGNGNERTPDKVELLLPHWVSGPLRVRAYRTRGPTTVKIETDLGPDQEVRLGLDLTGIMTDPHNLKEYRSVYFWVLWR